jgi:hypothetical protein
MYVKQCLPMGHGVRRQQPPAAASRQPPAAASRQQPPAASALPAVPYALCLCARRRMPHGTRHIHGACWRMAHGAWRGRGSVGRVRVGSGVVGWGWVAG